MNVKERRGYYIVSLANSITSLISFYSQQSLVLFFVGFKVLEMSTTVHTEPDPRPPISLSLRAYMRLCVDISYDGLVQTNAKPKKIHDPRKEQKKPRSYTAITGSEAHDKVGSVIEPN